MIGRLYPPVLGGTLPSCYFVPNEQEPEKGTVSITVPFSMNKTVGSGEISGYAIRIKTTSTDKLIVEQTFGAKACIIDGTFATLSAVFSDQPNIFRHYSIGTYFKVQIAYIDNTGEIGYYSSIAIIKYTSKPEISIASLDENIINMDLVQYVGEYYNEDPTETVAKYKFILYSTSGNILEESDWKIHNSYADIDSNSSYDIYKLKTVLGLNQSYQLQYKIITNNNLEVASRKYYLQQSNLITPEVTVTINAKMDEDNGCIKLSFTGDIDPKTGQEYIMTGTYVISRSSSRDNYSTWLDILHFTLIGDFPSNFKFNDFTIEHGESYRYSFQQYNNFGIYSARILSQDVQAVFEDAFLFDGERQLRIRYNPKISSFKTTLLDSKKTTIGGKYPIFFRNGNVEYKEFPISGLVTYFTDNDEFFFKKKDVGFAGWENTTDIIDSNIYLERQFKLSVLNWLNDGKIKMFKSPQEGNYIVRISNVTLTPNDSLSRMLHTFNCTATEMADFTNDNLEKYDLIHTTIEPRIDLKWRSVNLQEWIQKRIQSYIKYDNMSLSNATDKAKRDMINYDFAEGKQVYHFKIESADPGLKIRTGTINGAQQDILVGQTGFYEASFEIPFQGLSVSSWEIDGDNPTQAIPMMIGPSMSGILTYAIASTSLNTFDSITQIQIKDLVCQQFFGPDDNILAPWNDVRMQVQRVYYAHFVQKQYEELVFPISYSIKEFNEFIKKITTPYTVFYYQDPTIRDEHGNMLKTYYYYTGTNIVKVGVDEVLVRDFFNKTFKDPTYWKFSLNEKSLTKRDILFSQAYTQGLWNFISPYAIYHKIEDNKDKYYIFDVNKNQFVELVDKDGNPAPYDTSIEFGDSHLDVADIGEIWIPDLESVPDKIKIGNGVYAELGFTYRVLSYAVEGSSREDKCFYDKYTWLLENQKYLAAKQGMAIAGSIKYPNSISATHTQAEVLYDEENTHDKNTLHDCYIYDIKNLTFVQIPDNLKRSYWHLPMHKDFTRDGKTVWTPIYYYPIEDDAVPTSDYIENQKQIAEQAYTNFLSTLQEELMREEELRA